MTDAELEARRARSAALFNNRYFADVAVHALAVSSHGEDLFTARMIASETGLADSVVRPVLLRMVDAEVLERLPRAGGGRSAQYYAVKDGGLLARLSELFEVPRADPTGAEASS